MRIKKAVLHNIRSYENQEFSFPEGSLLLSGDIGSGKTSLLLAIEYALFGLQPGQSGASLLRNGSEFGEVSLYLEVDGLDVIIERRLRRGSKTITNEYAAITINDEKKECSITELKTIILELLGYPQEFVKKNNLLYRYTVYTPQESMKQIILDDSETRLNILRHIFGIDKYRIIRENVLILIAKLKDDSKILQIEIKNLEQDKQRLSALKNDISSIVQRSIVQSERLRECVSKRKYLESEVLQWQDKLKDREKMERELDKAKILISSKKEQISDISKQISDLSNTLTESGPEFDSSLFEGVISQIDSKRHLLEQFQDSRVSLQSKIQAYDLMKNENSSKQERVFQMDFCPTCLQDVPPAHKHNIMNEVETKIVEITKILSSLKSENENLLKSLEKERKSLSSLEEQKMQLEIHKSRESFKENSRKKLDESMKTRDSLDKDISLLNQHISTLKEDLLKSSSLLSQHRAKQEELKKAFVEEKGVEIAIAQLRREEELKLHESAILEETIRNKETLKSKLNYTLELTDWLSNNFINLVDITERNVLLKLRQEFSRLFAKWFQILVGDSFIVTLDETFSPVVLQGDTEMDYSFLSGGERTALALAYRLALNQVITYLQSTLKTKDILILDEPTDGFSETQLERMRDVLEDLDVSQLIMVSHEPKIEGLVDQVIRLKKEEDSSQIDLSTPSFFFAAPQNI